jgi:acetoin utilization protein AcuB
VFYIFDQGARVSTPVDRLLEQRDIAAAQAAARVGRVAAQVEYAGARRAAATYQREQQPPPRREPIIYAGQLMSAPVQTVPQTQTVADTQRLFAKVRYHHLPVIDERQELVGIISDRDLLRACLAQIPANRIDDWPLSRLMSTKVICATADTEIRVLAEVMAARHISALPIVDAGQRVVGMVTRSDILRALVHRAPLELWT